MHRGAVDFKWGRRDGSRLHRGVDDFTERLPTHTCRLQKAAVKMLQNFTEELSTSHRSCPGCPTTLIIPQQPTKNHMGMGMGVFFAQRQLIHSHTNCRLYTAPQLNLCAGSDMAKSPEILRVLQIFTSRCLPAMAFDQMLCSDTKLERLLLRYLCFPPKCHNKP